jgi:plasmid stabilization system protein ParE
MNYQIVLSPGADADLKSVVSWYLNIDPNLAVRFLREYKIVLRRIRRLPYAFAIHTDASRRARMNRFPYYVRYTVAMNMVTISAIVHQRRG